MSDAIVWYAPQLLAIVVTALLVLAGAVTVRYLKKKRDDERYFEYIEEATL